MKKQSKPRDETANEILSRYVALDEDFKRLGFDKDRDCILFNRMNGPYAFFQMDESVELPGKLGSIRIGFDIMGFIDIDTPEYRVELIGVSIYRSENNADTTTFNIEKFAIGDGPLPTKDEILDKYRHNALQLEQLVVVDGPFNKGRIEEIKRRFATALSQQKRSARWGGR